MNATLFGRISAAAVSGFLFCVAAVTSAETSAGTAVLISFASEHCGPCQAMQPTVRQLINEGTPVREVDVRREPEFARRHGIRQTPTFVIWSEGREVTRLVGTQSAQSIRDALSLASSGPLFRTGANVSPAQSSPEPIPSTTSPGRPVRPVGISEAMPSTSVADAVQRARAATVRLRVHDGHGFGVGTGTIIDRHGDEALVLTCGHLFRETKMESKIEVDLFVGGRVVTVGGQVVDYDSEQRDIGLVSIRPGFDVQPVAIAGGNALPQTGQSAFSFGCDRGDDPSRRDTRITGIDKYNQHLKSSNVEIAGAPIDGRSGGGLFDQSGRLIGVCNAADYKGDVGIYTGPGSIRWQLDRVQLSHLYQSNAAPMVAGQSQNRFDAAPSRMEAETRLASLPSNTASAGQAMTVTVHGADGRRVMTVHQPTAELLSEIRRHAR